ncbi:MAG: nucleotidyl transferase AbiEii/AbiGii toxin family protein [Deltaproteobacteria bacterium]|nr:nucleotidyl transferase AbiEii/AbiGii toxin family protein [Deltaproteobacteria bacterium]
MPENNQARSINDRLSNLAKKSGLGFEKVAMQFLLERLAVRLVANRELAKRLVFKGGYVGVRVYQSPRFTTDLDAVLRSGTLKKIESLVIAASEADIGDGVWFKFQNSIDLETQGEYGGIRYNFRAGIGDLLKDLKRARLINFDIGVGDPITPKEVATETPFLLGGGTLSWDVYPPETVVAEKLHTLLTRGAANSRARDVFDLNLLIPKCDSKVLSEALRATFKHRGDALPKDITSELKKMDRTLMSRGWKSAVLGIVGPSSYDEAFDNFISVISKLRSEGKGG